MFRSSLIALVLGSIAVTGCGGVVEERVVVREPVPPAVVVSEPAPAAVIVTTHRRVWVPSHWEHRGHERVWVEAHWRA
jgi:hypothetical protein